MYYDVGCVDMERNAIHKAQVRSSEQHLRAPSTRGKAFSEVLVLPSNKM